MLSPAENDRKMHARAVESAIWQCLQNAWDDREKEDHWRRHADRLEHKFTTDYGRHYSYFL
jgi:hypothetical protein